MGLAAMARKKNRFRVVNMEPSDFFNFKNLYEKSTSQYVVRKKTSTGDPFYISRVVHCQVKSSDLGILYYKTAFDGDFNKVDYNRQIRTTRRNMGEVHLEPLISKPINIMKFRHLQN
ncbi:hypothetical protein WA026_000644 [Henosepilachna vigintioctopunctata]|uniref:Uncharacterized protein n=1 Tax=Henosepilachna vigintioctopunctata TaxID=420089 RepID=A0AAW1V6R1_9CUCU